MAHLDIQVAVDQVSVEAARTSIAALLAAVERLKALDQSLPNGLMLPDDVGDLIRREAACVSTPGTTILNGIEFEPSDRHLELCAAIAAHRDEYVVWIIHGWPLLVLSSHLPVALHEPSTPADCPA